MIYGMYYFIKFNHLYLWHAITLLYFMVLNFIPFSRSYCNDLWIKLNQESYINAYVYFDYE